MQKQMHEANTKSCADFALKKYEDQLKSCDSYNKKIIFENAEKMRKDLDFIDDEKASARKQKLSLGSDLRIQMKQKEWLNSIDRQMDLMGQAGCVLPSDSAEQKMMKKQQKIDEQRTDLSLQIQLKSFIAEKEAKETLEREKNEYAFIQETIDREEYEKVIKKAETQSELSKTLYQQIKFKERAEKIKMIANKIK